MIKDFLPSKKVLIFLVIPIISFLLFFAFKFFIDKNFTQNSVAENNLKEALKYQAQEKDTDSDGLLDWEERLYGTNIEVEDSDGDGILDGLEVKTGTDPTDPKNEQDISQIKDIEEDLKTDSSLTQSEKMSRFLLLKIFELKQKNKFGDKKALENAARDILEKSSFSFVGLQEFTKEDLNISNISKKDFVENYKNLIDKSNLSDAPDEINAMGKYLENQEKIWAEELALNLKINTDFLEGMKKLEVSEEISMDFLDFLNSWNRYLFILKYFIDNRENIFALIQLEDVFLKQYEDLKKSSKELNYILLKNSI